MKRVLLACAFLTFAACQTSNPNRPNPQEELVVAAAASLTDAFAAVGQEFTRQTGIKVVFSFGATADLARQIENGAPFDVFAAADTAHAERLERQGLLTEGTLALYARGRLVMWLPPRSTLKVQRIEDITAREFERIAIAKPDVAPYGQATVESLRALGLWAQIAERVVYGQNVAQTKQFAATGNAELAFIPLALVKPGEGIYIEVNEGLHKPIDQALGIIKTSPKQSAAQNFVTYLLSGQGQEIMKKKGFGPPASQ